MRLFSKFREKREPQDQSRKARRARRSRAEKTAAPRPKRAPRHVTASAGFVSGPSEKAVERARRRAPTAVGNGGGR